MSALRLAASLFTIASVGSLDAQIFGPSQVLSLPATNVQAVAAGDLNGDGALDLVVASSDDYHVLLGNGAGGFGVATTGVFPPVDVVLVRRIALADTNGDGRLDLLAGHAQGATVLFGDGAGAFTGGHTLPDVRQDFVYADVNGDRRPDFVGLAISGALVVAFGDGTGAWGPLVSIDTAPSNLAMVVVGDVDGDGDRDIVVQDMVGGALATWLGNGAGSFVAGPASPGAPGFSLVDRVALVDVGGDGRPDVVTNATVGGVGVVRIATNLGGGAFATPVDLPAPSTTYGGFADLDGDGVLDVVALGASVLAVHRGTGGGVFAAPLVTPTATAARAVVADFDRDGRIDAALVGSTLQVFANQLAMPVGLVAYGTGTAGCAGSLGITGTLEPAIGENAFRVVCSNTPANAAGLLAMGTRVTNGWNPLGLGLTFHLGFAIPVAVMHSDPGGVGAAPLPIPAIPWLAGLTVHVQSFWIGDTGLGDTCSSASFELQSSRGLSITLQP